MSDNPGPFKIDGRIHILTRPEGGAERDVVYFARHMCKMGLYLNRVDGRDDHDLLIYPIGLVGWEMPLGVPFEVWPAQPCEACGGEEVLVVQWKVKHEPIFLS